MIKFLRGLYFHAYFTSQNQNFCFLYIVADIFMHILPLKMSPLNQWYSVLFPTNNKLNLISWRSYLTESFVQHEVLPIGWCLGHYVGRIARYHFNGITLLLWLIWVTIFARYASIFACFLFQSLFAVWLLLVIFFIRCLGFRCVFRSW